MQKNTHVNYSHDLQQPNRVLHTIKIITINYSGFHNPHADTGYVIQNHCHLTGSLLFIRGGGAFDGGSFL